MKALLLWMIRFLPTRDLASAPALLPLYPHLLPVRAGGGGEVRRLEGGLAGSAPRSAVQPLPPAEIHPVRPRTVMEVRNQFNNVEVPLWVFF